MKKTAFMISVILGLSMYAHASQPEVEVSRPYVVSLYSESGSSRILLKRWDSNAASSSYSVVVDTGESSDCLSGRIPSTPKQPIAILPLVINGKYISATALCFDDQMYYQIKTAEGRRYVDTLVESGTRIIIQRPAVDQLSFSSPDGEHLSQSVQEAYGGM